MCSNTQAFLWIKWDQSKLPGFSAKTESQANSKKCVIEQRKLVLSDPCRWVEQCLSLLLCLVKTTQPLMKNWNSDKKASNWRQFFIVCPLIDDKMKS